MEIVDSVGRSVRLAEDEKLNLSEGGSLPRALTPYTPIGFLPQNPLGKPGNIQ